MKNAFLRSAAVVLETDDIGFDTEFRNLSGWCSLQGFGLLVMMENEWNSRIGIEEFLAMTTLKDLFDEALLQLAAEVFGTDRRELSLSTRRDALASWDSVNHLRLVMEAEKRFGVEYRMEDIPGIETLADFAALAAEGEKG